LRIAIFLGASALIAALAALGVVLLR